MNNATIEEKMVVILPIRQYFQSQRNRETEALKMQRRETFKRPTFFSFLICVKKTAMTRRLSGKARIEIVRGAAEVATNNESNVFTTSEAFDVKLIVMYILATLKQIEEKTAKLIRWADLIFVNYIPAKQIRTSLLLLASRLQCTLTLRNL